MRGTDASIVTEDLVIAREGATGVSCQRLPSTSTPSAKMTGSSSDNGSDNDFVMIDNRAGLPTGTKLPELAGRVCGRGVSIGADGVVTIERPADRRLHSDFLWR